MELKKSFDFIKKYKTAIFLPTICIMQLLACFFRDTWIIATVLGILLLLISDFDEILYYIIFFQMFSALGIFSVTCTFVGAGLICLKYIIGLVKITEKFYPLPFILTCLICFFCSIHFIKIDIHGVYQGSSLIVTLFLIYLLFVYRDRFKISKCADFLVCGLLATLAISLASMILDGEILQIFDGTGELKRLKLLTGNENSLAIYCSLALSIYVSQLLIGKTNIYKNIIFGLVVIAVGLSTLSKCFLVICLFIILYLFVMLIIKYKLKSLTIIIPALVLLGLVSLAMQTKIDIIFDRFLIALDNKLSLSALTTGRSDLWTKYINFITSSIPNMLFGVGFFNERIEIIGPHNLFIHLLYRMGFLGLLGLGILAYFYYKDSHKSTKLTLENCLPLLVFLLISMVENFL